MAENTDMKSHVATYDGMIGWLKWGAIVCFILAAFVIWLLV